MTEYSVMVQGDDGVMQDRRRLIKKSCLVCGKELEVLSEKVKYCSIECSEAKWEDQKKNGAKMRPDGTIKLGKGKDD